MKPGKGKRLLAKLERVHNMSGHVQRQIDVGAITLQSLAAFSPMLAAISADDVTPTAMIQLENLGSCFPTNGPIALKVPDLLQRCTSTRLERIGLVIGWRKGDASSLMSQSAGGQSISLLSACLVTLFGREKTGQILQGLSSNLIPASLSISSVSQLARVADVLHAKLDLLGFGNLLAQHFVKFSTVFEMLGHEKLRTFSEEASSDTVLALLQEIGQVLREDQKIIRITGFHGMSYLTWLTLTLFPYDTTVVVDNLITHEGLRKKLLIVIDSNKTIVPFTVSVEKILGSAVIGDLLSNPPLGNILPGFEFASIDSRCLSFLWKGWLADYTTLEISRIGCGLPEGFIEACSHLFAWTAKSLMGGQKARKDSEVPSNNYPLLFEHYSRERIERRCRDLFLSNVFLDRLEPAEALRVLDEFISQVTAESPCYENVYNHNEPMKAWASYSLKSNGYREPKSGLASPPLCIHERLWEIAWTAVENGVLSLFIDAGPNTVVPHQRSQIRYGHREFLIRIDDVVAGRLYSSAGRICDHINELFDLGDSSLEERTMAFTSSSSTIYPRSLRTLRIPGNGTFFYELFDGRLAFNQQYFNRLTSEIPKIGYRPEAISEGSCITPSNVGQHDGLQFTIRERSNRLDLVADARCGGEIFKIDMGRIVGNSMVVANTIPCNHPRDSPLEKGKHHLRNLKTVSVGQPYLKSQDLAIAQVKGNPTAQFLYCGHGRSRIMMRDCCLNCAVDQAIQGKFEVIIVC